AAARPAVDDDGAERVESAIEERVTVEAVAPVHERAATGLAGDEGATGGPTGGEARPSARGAARWGRRTARARARGHRPATSVPRPAPRPATNPAPPAV